MFSCFKILDGDDLAAALFVELPSVDSIACTLADVEECSCRVETYTPVAIEIGDYEDELPDIGDIETCWGLDSG